MNESVIKTLVVALIVCLLCSLVVSSVAVSLRDAQNLNKLNDQRIKVLQAAGIYDDTKSIEEQFNSITSKLIDFENNAIVDSFGDIDLSTYDPVEYSKKDGYFTPIAPNDDIAVIKNREKFGKIFILTDSENNLSKVILPIRGYGLWGTLYGYISLSSDLNTIEGLEFYEHKETCLLYTSPSPRDATLSRMPSSA